MKQPPIKQDWMSRCLDVYNFHAAQLRDEPSWTVSQTADALNRSIGSVSQDLLLASWLRTHERQLKRCNQREALEFVRTRKREMRTQELEL